MGGNSRVGWSAAIAVALMVAPGGMGRLFAQEAPPPPASIGTETVLPAPPSPKLPHFSTESGVGPDYVIGPEDVLKIAVFQVKDLDETVRVSNDGTIAVPLLGRITASGLTAYQLRQKLEQAYGRNFLQNPQVSVFVKEFHAQPVSVIGAVQKPGLYHITGPRNLIEALSMAGGLASGKGAAPGKFVYVTRKAGFQDLQVVPGMHLKSPHDVAINLHDLLYTQDARLNIPIRPHDIVAVSTASVIYVVGGGVRKPGGYALENRDEVTVIQALAMAEGLAPDAAKKRARIIHTKADGSRVDIPINIGEILNEKVPDPTLAANDILYIPLSGGKAAVRRTTDAIVSTLSGLLIYHPP